MIILLSQPVWSSDQLNIAQFFFFFLIIRLTSAVLKVRMESERQAKRIPEGPSEKDLSNNLYSDLEELTKVFEKNLEALENMVKLIKSDVSKMFDISNSNFPSSSINANLE